MLERANNFRMTDSDHWRKPSRAMLRKAHRARVLPGFPVVQRFETMQDVDAYLSGPKLQCLLCGKLFLSVGAHVRLQHAVPPDEYRERFGIPFGRPLCAGTVSAKHSELTAARLQNPASKAALLEHLATGRKMHYPSRGLAPAVVEQRRARFKNLCPAATQKRLENLRQAARVYSTCFRCESVKTPTRAPGVCDKCRSVVSKERRREIGQKHYYKDLDRTRALLRDRATRARQKKSGSTSC